jgi:hypothetical protein
MKTVLTRFLAISSVPLLLLASCKKNDPMVKTNGGTAGTLSANTTSPVLDKAKISDTSRIINFAFTKPSFGFSAASTNTLQIDAQGDNWASPTSVTLGTGVYSQSYSTGDFNAILLKMNLPSGVASQVQARIQYNLGGGSKPIYSNVLSLNVTPFNLKSWVYVPGAYEGASWPNPGPLEDSLYSATSNGIYVGIINFTAGNNQFLITPQKNWNNKWATTQNPNTTDASVTYSVTYNGPNNFYAPTAAGQYLVTLNTNANTITIEPADYYTIIGNAPPGTAWQTDYPMKYINDGSCTWVASNVPMVVGEYKFRQDAQWTNSWGPTGTDGTITDSSPIGDGNIALTTAGNYNLTFVMPATPYGTKPATTTTYTAVKQ